MKLPQPFTKEEFINVVIETPKGSRNKFTYDAEQDYFKLNKVLPEGTVFPVDVGFVPQTKAGDGDPLDVFVFMEGLTYPGCVVECRATGIIEVEQEYKGKKYRNDRIIAVPIGFAEHKSIFEITDIDTDTLNELLNFCRYYNEFEGKKFNVIAIKGNEEAMKAVQESHKNKKTTNEVELNN